MLVTTQTVNNATAACSNWSGVATLQHGSQYASASGRASFPNDSLYFADGPNSCSAGTMLGKRTYTTIDRSKPAVSIAAASGAASTKDSSIPVQIAFSDDVAGPHPANFLCVGAGTDPCQSNQYSAACSVPDTPGKSTTFGCHVDASQLPDGPVTVCVIASDTSVPDNPGSANQSGTAMGEPLGRQCDTVTLDRSVPPPGPRHPRSGHPGPDAGSGTLKRARRPPAASRSSLTSRCQSGSGSAKVAGGRRDASRAPALASA
jgi:hypothetical protein